MNYYNEIKNKLDGMILYYINQCIVFNLSRNKLRDRIITKEYELI